MNFDELTPLRIGEGRVQLLLHGEGHLKPTYKGYAPVLVVENLHSRTKHLLYASAKSLMEGLEPLREDNQGRFDGIRRERRTKSAWFDMKRLSPMSLTTLGQLRELLDGDWSRLGDGLGPREIVLGSLLKIEFYRNELSHCRSLSFGMVSDLRFVERSLARLITLAEQIESGNAAA